MNKNVCVNTANLCGLVTSDVEFSHSLNDVDFYKFTISIPRLSDKVDRIVIIARRGNLPGFNLNGKKVKVNGSFRSYNSKDGSGRLLLFVFAKSVEITDEEDMNSIVLSGFVCKQPIVRKTSSGVDIADVFLAVNMGRNSFYIPMILWNSNATAADFIRVGDFMSVDGRLQSREFKKMKDNGEIEEKTAYEVSVKNMSIEVDEND